jgi:hypothetical protein
LVHIGLLKILELNKNENWSIKIKIT